ncbi:cyclopropane-fatty-acyl-phospholipid synthase family protein [Streptomyces sp. IB2014 016-6]|uniref:SAM-dependent methyltransferase n=1 Tax=Streptomyces sp. IB2014 016-6 TaxID=2517818 RepID=UPI0011CC11F8|nr:cyclopropane-fatty-acyl-phospholipid synthase family protein [Streptomyces sp. IB2014 016-6]TXL86242.1 class I SAM-dependent methyltransferase [Streptomyces sp. IB2014 016-6]
MSVHVSPPSPTSPEPAVAAAESAAGAAATKVGAAPATASSPVDARRWPDVARQPRASWPRTAIAERVVRHALARPALRVRLGEGETLGLGGPLMVVRDPHAFFRRIGATGLIGFGESYMAGEWEADDLVGVLTVLAENAAVLVPAPLQRLRRLWALKRPDAQRNTPEGSRDNISHHYDLSNELFALFLDETLSYSSALFRGFPADASLLPAAQHRKIDRLLDEARVGPGTRLLEIGTGWGELAIRAARRGANVVTVTLSQEQLGLAERRIRAAGVEDRVTVRLCDYRRVRGTFDAVVSVEMIEAVGEEFWPEYFTTLDRLLAPGGRIALQAITMPHDRLLASRSTHTWIGKYIFPGGLIPSVEVMEQLTAAHTSLRVVERDGFGPHYAQTLRLWRERFAEQESRVDALGFDATFRRMWTFYLAYSEAGFRSGYLDVQQMVLAREGTTR